MAPKAKAPASTDGPRRSGRASTAASSTATAEKAAAPIKRPASKADTKGDNKKVKITKEPAEVIASTEGESAPAIEQAEKAEEDAAAAEPAAAAKTGPAAVGDSLPDVKVTLDDGSEVELKTLYADKTLVIFSYPKANTPGCTNQATGYGKLFADFTAAGANVVGLSGDSVKAQASWKAGKELPFNLISDGAGVLLKPLGYAANKRSHWVVEKGTGKILEAKLGVKPADDPQNALNFVKSL